MVNHASFYRSSGSWHQRTLSSPFGFVNISDVPFVRLLVQAAMKAVHRDAALENFYSRIRKRSSAKIALVAAARKLAEICWKRLRQWERAHADQAA
jgi:hypothetical protein